MLSFLLLIIAIYIFWPRYDLVIALDPFWSQQQNTGQTFLWLGGCQEAGEETGAVDFGCFEWNRWSKMMSDAPGYTSRH
jgi:hypothetical protein